MHLIFYLKSIPLKSKILFYIVQIYLYFRYDIIILQHLVSLSQEIAQRGPFKMKFFTSNVNDFYTK